MFALMTSSAERPQERRFKIVGIIGVLFISVIGTLVSIGTGWSPWITYGIPLVVLFSVTLPLARAARREGMQIRNTESGNSPESDW